MKAEREQNFAWELSKENVAPVAKGRNVEKLNNALMKLNSIDHKVALINAEK